MPPKSTTKAEPIHGAGARAEKSAKAAKPKPRGKRRPSEFLVTPVPNKETPADDADETGAPPGLVSDGPFNSRDYQWHTHTVQQVAEIMQLPDYTGVDREHIAERRATFGDNVIPIDTGKNVLLMFASHCINSISPILAVVAGICLLQGQAEFGVGVFVFNGLVAFWQEYSAEKLIQGLKDMTAGSAKVVRSGRVEVVEIDDVVVGDVVILEQGVSVAADLRLFEANNLAIDESLLTGEAMPVVKHVNRIHDPDLDSGLGDRKNLAFRQTLVTSGTGKGIVVAGGKVTEMGKILGRLTDRSGSSEVDQKVKHMMCLLFGVCFILALFVFFVNGGWWDFHDRTILYAAAAAIAVLPVGLVTVSTVAMTISIRRMATQKRIVRKLAALEVLGNVTDICSENTGTLTEDKMVAKLAREYKTIQNSEMLRSLICYFGVTFVLLSPYFRSTFALLVFYIGLTGVLLWSFFGLPGQVEVHHQPHHGVTCDAQTAAWRQSFDALAHDRSNIHRLPNLEALHNVPESAGKQH